jgi:signal transduction histidine kinase
LVRDNGDGVPTAELDRIFAKSYRGSNAGNCPGSGLGLYMARSVVEVHGGTVEACNVAPGGAEFRIWLPNVSAGKHVASLCHKGDNPRNKSY